MEQASEWELRHDESSGQPYYVNLRTGESSWEAPETLAVPSISAAPAATQWSEAYDDSGRLYYVNLETMETSWDPPHGYLPNVAHDTTEEVSIPHQRPSTAQQMDELNALLSGEGGEDDGEEEVAGDDIQGAEDTATVSHEGNGDGSEWMMFMNETDGVPYYYNHLTGECVWEAPAAFLEYHAQLGSSESHEALEDPDTVSDANQTGRRATRTPGTAPTPPPLSTPPIAVPITPEFEEKVRRAIETVSKTPVGSSRLLFVRTPTVKALDTESSSRPSSRPGSSTGSARVLVSSSRGSTSPSSSSSARQRMGTVADDAGVHDQPVISTEQGAEAALAYEESYATTKKEQEEHPHLAEGENTTDLDSGSGETYLGQSSEDTPTPIDTVAEKERKLQIQEEMTAELMLAEAAIVTQCLVRCFLARRRVERKRQERAAVSELQEHQEHSLERDEQQPSASEQPAITSSLPREQIQVINAVTEQEQVIEQPLDTHVEETLAIVQPDEPVRDDLEAKEQQGEPHQPEEKQITMGITDSSHHALPAAILDDPPVRDDRVPDDAAVHAKTAIETTRDTSSAHTARRPGSQSQVVAHAIVKRESLDTSTGCLAILNVSSHFPRVASPSCVPTRPRSPPQQSTDHQKYITRKLITVSPTREATKSPERAARTQADDAKRSERDVIWQQEIATYRQTYEASALRHSQAVQKARAREQERQQASTPMQRKDSRALVDEGRLSNQRETQESPFSPWGRMANWQSTRPMEKSVLVGITSELSHASFQPTKLIDMMMRERLRSLRTTVQRLSDFAVKNTKAKDLQAYWEARIATFPSDNNDENSRDPYWRRVTDQLHRFAKTSSNLGQMLAGHRGSDMQSILHEATWLGQLDLVEFLVNELHAEVNSVDSVLTRTTPLHEACRGGHIRLVRFLLSRGAHIDAVDHSGDTPLHVVCRLGHCQEAHALVVAGEMQGEGDQMMKLLDSNTSTNDQRVLCSQTWTQCLALQNLKKRRAVDVAKLPSLVEFVSDAMHAAGCGDAETKKARVNRGNIASASSSGSTSTKTTKKHKLNKTNRPKSATKVNSVLPVVTAKAAGVHAR